MFLPISSSGVRCPRDGLEGSRAAGGLGRAHRVVAEANNGGRMVESVLSGADVALPVRLVHAAEGKSARAEPVAALFEAKRARPAVLSRSWRTSSARSCWAGAMRVRGARTGRTRWYGR